MCGVAGWLSFTGDASARRSIVEEMTATMACRGPDSGGVWSGRHVCLGHRRLAVIDLEGGAQPMVAEGGGRARAVITYGGEVYNFGQLREQLRGAGHRFRTRSDTEVVLRAYLEWGADFGQRLNGMFGLALWDAEAEELLLVRDRLGIKPLYYFPTGDGVIFGSEPKAVLAHPDVRARVGAAELREFFTWVNTPGHTLFEGMRQVRPGHVVRVSRAGVTETAYWALTARPHGDDLPTTTARVRELLAEAVRAQTVADVPLGVLLSGGLDSSSVAVFAAAAMQGQGRPPLNTYAVGFAPGGAEAAVVGRAHQAADEDVRHAELLAARIGAHHETITVDSDRLSDPQARSAVLHARDSPQGFADMDTSLYLLFGAVRRHSTVALSGEGADELFGGYPWFHDEATIGSGTFPWFGGKQDEAPVGPSFIDPGLPQRLEFDEYRRQRYSEAVALCPVLPGESAADRRMRVVSYLFLTRFLPMLLERKDRMSMAVGLEVRVPFCDHELVEYVFNVPWGLKTYGGREKALLRDAVSGDVPQFVLRRRKQAYPTAADPKYDETLKERLADIMDDADAPIWALMDPPRAREAFVMVRAAPPERLRALRMVVESLVRTNDWMRAYGVELTG